VRARVNRDFNSSEGLKVQKPRHAMKDNVESQIYLARAEDARSQGRCPVVFDGVWACAFLQQELDNLPGTVQRWSEKEKVRQSRKWKGVRRG